MGLVSACIHNKHICIVLSEQIRVWYFLWKQQMKYEILLLLGTNLLRTNPRSFAFLQVNTKNASLQSECQGSGEPPCLPTKVQLMRHVAIRTALTPLDAARRAEHFVALGRKMLTLSGICCSKMTDPRSCMRETYVQINTYIQGIFSC